MTTGRSDRSARLADKLGRPTASSSQDYVRLANLLYRDSALQAQSLDGNCSHYALAGIPVLFFALRALLIEGNSGMYGSERNDTALEELDGPDLKVLFKHYTVPGDLQDKLRLLNEVRNEIVHPVHISAGTSHGTPAYLSFLRENKLLQSTGNDLADYTWISQLKSHSLFRFSFEVIEEVARIILEKHHVDDALRAGHLQSYSRYKDVSVTA